MTIAAEDPAEHLGAPREDGVAQRDLLRQQHPERDRRVDVAAADRPDHVGHDQQGEAEREGDAEDADASAARIAAPGPHMTSTAVPTNSAATIGA